MANEQNSVEGKARTLRYVILLVIIPALIPLVCLFLRDSGWTVLNSTMIGAIFAGYWVGMFVVLARLLRSNTVSRTVRLASPLIELQLSSDLRDRLANFAAARQQKISVATFHLLDAEIPRFEQAEDRDRALHDNEQLRQQAGQGAFLVAVTNEILRRLLLLSGADEGERDEWPTQINDTAIRIVSNALEQKQQVATI